MKDILNVRILKNLLDDCYLSSLIIMVYRLIIQLICHKFSFSLIIKM